MLEPSAFSALILGLYCGLLPAVRQTNADGRIHTTKRELKGKRRIVAAFYFPGFHSGDKLLAELEGKGWNEWALVKNAKPRFPGHVQPKVPVWGYESEALIRPMVKKINAAADHGIDAFIFDWYWYRDRPFLNRPLDHAFLRAPNVERMKFALMWANHNWVDIFPQKSYTPKLLLSGQVDAKTFDHICDYVIGHYFTNPHYLKIDGKPFFSIYELYNVVKSLGGIENTRIAFARFRSKARAAGLPGIHFNAVAWGVDSGEARKVFNDPRAALKIVGIDSTTSYVWIHHAWPPKETIDYDAMRDLYFKYWDSVNFGVPYYPNVTIGWDPTPRRYDPFRLITNNTPERFREALKMTRDRMNSQMLTINAWNEWTEGSYLEPDRQYGMAYLDAVRDVFGLQKTRVKSDSLRRR